jgi:trk system potassium uptake protein TrkA
VKKKRILVIGLGGFGSAIVEALWKVREVEVIAVDESDDAVDRVKSRTAAAFVGDVSDQRVLTEIGANDVDCAVVSFAEDFEASVLCVASLAKLGVKEIVARAANSRQVDVLKAIGATRVLELEREMGARIATEVIAEASSELLDFAHGYRVVPWVAHGDLVGKTLEQSDLRRKYDVTVLGFGNDPDGTGKPRQVTPATLDYVIAKGDILMLVADEVAMDRFLAAH